MNKATTMNNSTAIKSTSSFMNATKNPRQIKRERADARFRWYGITAIGMALAFLVFFFIDIIGQALPAFERTEVNVPVHYLALKHI